MERRLESLTNRNPAPLALAAWHLLGCEQHEQCCVRCSLIFPDDVSLPVIEFQVVGCEFPRPDGLSQDEPLIVGCNAGGQNARHAAVVIHGRQTGLNPVDKKPNSPLYRGVYTMKAVNKLAVLISLGALLPFAVSAKTSEQAYLDASLKTPGVPVPVAVVSPSDVDAKYTGAKVELAFTVDAMGIPTDFSVISSPDAVIAKVMMDAVSKWRFTPAQKNGIAVATKVVLPVKIAETDNRFAAN